MTKTSKNESPIPNPSNKNNPGSKTSPSKGKKVLQQEEHPIMKSPESQALSMNMDPKSDTLFNFYSIVKYFPDHSPKDYLHKDQIYDFQNEFKTDNFKDSPLLAILLFSVIAIILAVLATLFLLLGVFSKVVDILNKIPLIGNSWLSYFIILIFLVILICAIAFAIDLALGPKTTPSLKKMVEGSKKINKEVLHSRHGHSSIEVEGDEADQKIYLKIWFIRKGTDDQPMDEQNRDLLASKKVPQQKENHVSFKVIKSVG